LADGQPGPRGIALDDVSIFWANGGEDQDAGTIMRLAR
jgi:hypothetical protein